MKDLLEGATVEDLSTVLYGSHLTLNHIDILVYQLT